MSGIRRPNESASVPAAPAKPATTAVSVRDLANAPAAVTSMPSRGAAFLGFYNAKTARAQEIVTSLGPLGDGVPYVCFGKDDYHRVDGLSFILLSEFQYWATINNRNDLTWVSLTEQPFGAKIKGKRVKDCAAAVFLFLPGASPVPDALKPAFVAVGDCRGPRSPGVYTWLSKMKESQTPAWATKHGAKAASLPIRYRVTGVFDITSKQTQDDDGNPISYALVDARVKPTSVAQAEAIQAFEADPNTNAAVQKALERFRVLKADVEEVAAKSSASA